MTVAVRFGVWGAVAIGLVVGLQSFLAGRSWWFAFLQGYACALILVVLLYAICWAFTGLESEEGETVGKRLDISIGEEDHAPAD